MGRQGCYWHYNGLGIDYQVKFFGGSFLLFLFPTGCFHSRFKSIHLGYFHQGKEGTHRDVIELVTIEV